MSSHEPRTLDDWLYHPSFEDSICKNHFHDTMLKVFSGMTSSIGDPYFDENSISAKLSKLVLAKIVIPEGDVIYVRERDNLIPLGEAIQLLAYYMHTDTKTARDAANLLETNFQGYFPIAANSVWRNGIALDFGERVSYVDLATLDYHTEAPGIPEYGKHVVTLDHVDVLHKFFELINEAVGEPYFFEKTILYPFNQRIREKSHVLVGKGGNGKSLFMRLVQRLYGDRAYTDAPQPNFRGHDGAVIAYNFIGKRVVTFNDVGDPSEAFLEWLKRMITGNLEVKTPSGSWLSIPCSTNFMLETNHAPQVLNIEAHARRYVIRTFADDFRLIDHMTSDELDMVGERGDISAGDIACYLMGIKSEIDDWTEFTKPATEQKAEVESVDY